MITWDIQGSSMNEMKTSKNDIGIVVIFTTLSILLFNIPVLNNAEILTFLKIAVFFLLGYSLLAAVFPKNNINKVKFVLASILVSIILVFSLALILGVFLDFNNGTFINVSLILINVFIAAAFIQRIRSSNEKEDKYLICENCRSYYKLEEGETLDDFEACRCGGRLKYAEGIVSSVNVVSKDPVSTGTKKISKHRFFVNFSKYRYLLVELVKRDIKVKYRRSVLGIFWSFLNPLLMMVALTVIFQTIFQRNIENYPVYFITGKIVYDFYSDGSRAAMNSIRRNAGIIKKVYVPKYMYALSSVLSNFVIFGLSLIVLFVVMIATNAPFTFYMLSAVLPFLLLFMFTLGTGLLLATISTFFRDMEHLYGVFITLLMYGSAIFYPIDIIPEKYRLIFELNPVYALISLCRDSFMGGIFDLNTLLYASIISVISLVLGIILFYKYQDKFILYI